MPPAGRIPREIVEFFNAPGGHSLIAKGPAGTGKTTFALQLTEELGEVTASHYLSSRVSDESLFRQFVWLKERLKPAGLQSGGKVRAESKVARTALDQLEGKIMEGKEGDDAEPESIGGSEVKGSFLEVTLGFDLPELEAAYEFVDKRLPERSLVLIDSIDALGEHYGIPAARLITILQKDLVEASRQNVLYVLESSGETRLDYLGDGVVSLASSEYQGRRLRVLTIEKLRGQQVQQPRYLYTLDGGRLTAFNIREEFRPAKPQVWKPVKDLSKDAVSMGLDPLDRIAGGLSRGRVIAFQLPKAERPFLGLMAFDTLESVYGERVIEAMSGVFSALRRAKDVFVGFVTPDSASAAKLENLAYAVFRIDSVNGSVVLYGQKPYTELFNLSWDWSGGFPKAELRPIV